MPISTVLVLASMLSNPNPSIQNGAVWPKTRAEETGFKETSTYADVVKFIEGLQKAGAPIWVSTSGTSFEGKPIPMIVASRPLVHSVIEAKATGKPIVYIQGNIHAGEVEGKEAALSLLRTYCQEKRGILDKVILIVQPIYNIDGNEKFGPGSVNRPGQTGPDRVGVRPNGQGFDLNRDCVKLESPEMSGAVQNIYSWFPDVVMDLHTTDGTRHGFQLTYAGPLHPNTNKAIQDYTLSEFLPTVRAEAKSKYKLDFFDYGNGEKDQYKKWYWTTFAGEARYVTNYGGLRNAICILSEAMVYEPFKERVQATEKFVDLCLNKIAKDAKQVVENHRKADELVTAWGTNPLLSPVLATRFETTSRPGQEGKTEAILLEKQVNSERTPRSGPIRDVETIQMPVFDRFKASRVERFPIGYFLPSSAEKMVALLRKHGVRVEKLTEDWLGWGEKFTIRQVTVANQAFQGHKLIRLEGGYQGQTVQRPAGTYWVPTGQPLGLLVFDLLEPTGGDGGTAWGFFGDTFKENDQHPVQRIFVPLDATRVVIP